MTIKEKRLHPLLNAMVELSASDLHLKPGCKPILRVNGTLRAVNQPMLEPSTTLELADSMFNEEQKKIYEEKKEADLSYSVDLPSGPARFRLNIYQQSGVCNLVMRYIPDKIKDFKTLILPESLKKIASSSRGLILVTGTTGSGKSTTLAAIIDYINQNFSKNIITIEDPVEFIHKDSKSIISQREVRIDTKSYSEALRNVVRQDPDVILVGEMRDMETMSAALTAAETGHLVLSTIHTIDAMQTVSRIVDIFPIHHQNQIRLQLADCLCAVISQRLLPRLDKKGMVPAVEVLVVTALIRNLIEENNISSILEFIEKGDYYGMQTFNQALEELYKKGLVDIEDAKKAATNPEDLILRIKGIKSGSSNQS